MFGEMVGMRGVLVALQSLSTIKNALSISNQMSPFEVSMTMLSIKTLCAPRA
jgi:hypothetical protein